MSTMVHSAAPERGVVVPGPAVDEVEARRHRPGRGVACLLLFVGTLGAIGHVAIQFRLMEVGLALGEARRAKIRLLEEGRKLRLEVGVLKDPGRIMAIARDKLGMRAPDTRGIVALRELHLWTVGGPPPSRPAGRGRSAVVPARAAAPAPGVAEVPAVDAPTAQPAGESP